MKYKEVMEVLSCAGIGVLLLDSEDRILEVNPAGDRLLHGQGELCGVSLKSIAPGFCGESSAGYCQVVFGEYLRQCLPPSADDLAPGCRLIMFQDATAGAYREMLTDIINNIREAVILFDHEGRVCLLNSAAEEMDSMLKENARGKHVTELYYMLDGSEIVIPPGQAIREGKLRQDLFYRLGVVTLNVPPLRERKDDIPLMSKSLSINRGK